MKKNNENNNMEKNVNVNFCDRTGRKASRGMNRMDLFIKGELDRPEIATQVTFVANPVVEMEMEVPNMGPVKFRVGGPTRTEVSVTGTEEGVKNFLETTQRLNNEQSELDLNMAKRVAEYLPRYIFGHCFEQFLANSGTIKRAAQEAHNIDVMMKEASHKEHLERIKRNEEVETAYDSSYENKEIRREKREQRREERRAEHNHTNEEA